MKEKYYRCGYCGAFTDSNGDVLRLTKEQIDIIIKDKNYKEEYVEHTHGECCRSQYDSVEYVTRDMAIDAGDITLEGEEI